MKTGLLIYHKGDLTDGVRAAARAYMARMGAMPDECYVNAAAVAAPTQIGGVRVTPSARILPDHYWIGREEAQMPDLPLFRGAR